MPEMDDGPPRDIIISICGVCGFGLYSHEIAGEVMNGTFIDYQNRMPPGQIGFTLCNDCKQRLIYNLQNPDALEEAADKRAQIDEFDEFDRKERDK